jgi:hypothetical protein
MDLTMLWAHISLENKEMWAKSEVQEKWDTEMGREDNLLRKSGIKENLKR